MPKRQKSETLVRMSTYPLPAQRWVDLQLTFVERNGDMFRFVFTIPGRPDQAGREIEAAVPALLTPGSPLAGFLSAAFDIHLTMNDEIELSSLIGRRVQAQFAKPGPDGTQAITHWRPAAIAEPAKAPANRPATTARPASTSASTPSAAQTTKPAGPTSAISPPATTPSSGRATGGTAAPASPAAKGVSHGL